MKNIFLITLLGVLVVYISCNESTTVGSELIIDEDIDRGFIDTLSIKAKTIRSGPIPTYFTSSFLNSNFMIGELDDPIFGRTKSSIYFDMQPGGGSGFSGGTLDSMVMIFAFNSNGFYGDSTTAHTIEVWELGERLDVIDTIFSDQTFQRLSAGIMRPVASMENFVPSKEDSVTYISYVNEEVTSGIPQIRMRVNDRFAQMLFRDSIANASSLSLLEAVNGFVITSTPEGGNSMIGLDINEANPNTGIEVYFVNDIGTKSVGRYVFRRRRSQNFEISQDGATVQNFLDRDITNGDPLFVQGMSGVVTQFDLSSIRALDKELLNLAELEVFLYEDFQNDNGLLYPPAPSLALVKASDGLEVSDLLFGRLNRFIDILFGGILANSNVQGVRSYKMTITSYLKDVQDGIEDGIIRLEILDKAQSPRRSIIYGPGHPELAPQLKVSFTIP